MTTKLDKITIFVEAQVEVVLPTLPNFFRTPQDKAVPIHALSDASLQDIGQVWVAELIAKAQAARE